MKRRKFLLQTGYALPAFLFLPTLFNSCKKDDDDQIVTEKKFKKYHVVIVGAGASGLYAGWYLQERGFKVTILEASGQIGGRIRHLSGFADFDVELGADRVLGNNSEWYRIIQQTQATTIEDNFMQDFYFFRQDPGNLGEPVLKSKSEAQQYSEYVRAMNFVDNAPKYTGADMTVEQNLVASGISWSLFDVVNARLGNEHGTVNSRLSIRGLAEESGMWAAGDTRYLLKDRSLLSVLETKFAPILSKVVKNTQVRKIAYDGPKAILTDQTGTTFEADRVILTVPLKILRDGVITFSPALPTTKLAALENIGMGAGMKVIIRFSHEFWKKPLAENLGAIFGYPVVPKVYAANTGKGTTPVLTALIMGERAEQFSSQGSSAANAILTHLDNIFGGTAASQSKDDMLIMDWSKEPHIRGAWSYPVVGGGLIFRKELAAPIQERIFFAGEATHFGGHSGTVHGAVETGMRAVKELEESFS